MKRYTIGTLLVIVGPVVIATVSITIGFPRSIGVGLGFAVSIAGFAVQMYSVLKMQANAERKAREREAEHQAFMREIETLAPDKRDDRIIEKINELLRS